MTRPSSRKTRALAAPSARLARQMTELSLAVPQVVGHRLLRLAAAGQQPSARDRREFTRMGAEKLAAFTLSWQAMAWQMWRAQLALWTGPAAGWLAPWLSASGHAPAALRLMSAGLAPVHAAAVANARRLRRVRAR